MKSGNGSVGSQLGGGSIARLYPSSSSAKGRPRGGSQHPSPRIQGSRPCAAEDALDPHGIKARAEEAAITVMRSSATNGCAKAMA